MMTKYLQLGLITQKRQLYTILWVVQIQLSHAAINLLKGRGIFLATLYKQTLNLFSRASRVHDVTRFFFFFKSSGGSEFAVMLMREKIGNSLDGSLIMFVKDVLSFQHDVDTYWSARDHQTAKSSTFRVSHTTQSLTNLVHAINNTQILITV